MGIFDWLKRSTPRADGLPAEGSELLAQDVALDASELLVEWRWLIAPRFQPVLCTALGDLFLQGPGGAVFLLDVGSGLMLSAAKSAEHLDELAHEPERFAAWFRPDELHAARRRTRPLAPGECYSFVRAPRLGGRADERVPRAAPEHFQIHGRAFRPDSPAGARSC